MLCVLVALVSPIDALSTDVMFVHMIQHVLLLDVVPILFILSLTKGLLRPVTRRLTMHRGPRRLRRPSGVRGASCTSA